MTDGFGGRLRCPSTALFSRGEHAPKPPIAASALGRCLMWLPVNGRAIGDHYRKQVIAGGYRATRASTSLEFFAALQFRAAPREYARGWACRGQGRGSAGILARFGGERSLGRALWQCSGSLQAGSRRSSRQPDKYRTSNAGDHGSPDSEYKQARFPTQLLVVLRYCAMRAT